MSHGNLPAAAIDQFKPPKRFLVNGSVQIITFCIPMESTGCDVANCAPTTAVAEVCRSANVLQQAMPTTTVPSTTNSSVVQLRPKLAEKDLVAYIIKEKLFGGVEKTSLRCDLCGLGLANVANIDDHKLNNKCGKRAEYVKPGFFECNICLAAFESLDNVRQHLVAVHLQRASR